MINAKHTRIKRDSYAIVPMTPNFITVDGQTLSISKFTDNQLKQIGRAWTDALIERAAHTRKNKL